MASNGNGTHEEGKVMRIGSRDSELALKQTYMIRDALKKVHPDMKIEIVTMKTKGDKILDVALSKIGSKSLFTGELEAALAEGGVDIVVHSLKDLPTSLPPGMVVGAVGEREDPRDAVIMHPRYNEHTLSTLPDGAVVGTSSVRRTAQLKRRFPGLKFLSVRGNLNTRLRKLDQADDYAALVLAVAGVVRMGWRDRISQYLDEDVCMHAVGQGALGVECREGDAPTLSTLAHLAHPPTALATCAERAFMNTLEGGCSAPVAVYTKLTDNRLEVRGGVWSLDGSQQIIGARTVVFRDTHEPLRKMSKTEHATSSGSDDATSESGNEASEPENVQSEPEDLTAKLENLNSKPENQTSKPGKPTASQTYCGIVPLPGQEEDMKKAFDLGVSLAKSLLDEGAGKILQEAKAANQLSAPNVPPTKMANGGSAGFEVGEKVAA